MGLLVGHRAQSGHNVPQVLVGIEPQPPAVFDDCKEVGVTGSRAIGLVVVRAAIAIEPMAATSR